MLAVPTVFFTFTVIEGQFLSPLIIGRNLILNPEMILLSMLFWAWLWGPIGLIPPKSRGELGLALCSRI